MRPERTTSCIPLTRDLFATVDAEDLPLVQSYRWWAKQNGNTFYAAADVSLGRHQRERLLMHRVILGASPGESVDHIDGDGLNNCRANLRLATKSQNMMNARVRRDSTSGYRGVSYCRYTGRWQANIKKNGKRTFLGRFDTPEQAAEAYRQAADRLFGEYRRIAP